MIDHTKDPAEKPALINANECMKDVCEYINEAKRDYESIEVIFKAISLKFIIQNLITIKTIQQSIAPSPKVRMQNY